MSNNRVLSLDSSILYRCSQKYFDKFLSDYNLGYAQIIFLTSIYENEGISMIDLAQNGSFDKGTITKSIQKLQELNYVKVILDENDKRRRLLYTTEKSDAIMSSIYILKQKWVDYLLQDLNSNEINEFNTLFSKILNRCKEYNILEESKNNIHFFGIQKLTLLDYPGKLACTLFTGGCNFKCPFCHNQDLVFLKEDMNEISYSSIISFLKERKNVLDGICISGGEPLLHKGLKNFIKEVKELGYKIKLDTNGLLYDSLKELIDEKLIDYIAMDYKNSPRKYSITTDIDSLDYSVIEKSIKLIINSDIEYEFRTTIVKELHTIEDIKLIGEVLKGCNNFYLQNFRESENCIKQGYHKVSDDELKEYLRIIQTYIPNAKIRGME